MYKTVNVSQSTMDKLRSISVGSTESLNNILGRLIDCKIGVNKFTYKVTFFGSFVMFVFIDWESDVSNRWFSVDGDVWLDSVPESGFDDVDSFFNGLSVDDFFNLFALVDTGGLVVGGLYIIIDD